MKKVKVEMIRRQNNMLEKNNSAKSAIMVCLIGAVLLMGVLAGFSSMEVFIRYQRTNNTWW